MWRISSETLRKFKFFLFLSIFYLYPGGGEHSVRTEIAVIFGAVLLLLFNFRRIRIAVDSRYMVSFFLLFLIFINIRFVLNQTSLSSYIREYTEVFRLLVLMVFSLAAFKTDFKVFKWFIYFSFFYIFLDFTAVIAEVFFRDSALAQFVIQNYHSKKLARYGEYVKGLTTHSGLHGMIIMLLFIFHYCILPYFKKGIRHLCIIICALEIFIVFISGSRTHIASVVFFIALQVFLSFFLRKKDRKNIHYYFLAIAASILFFIIINYSEYFIRLFFFINNIQHHDTKGLGGRTDIWQSMLHHLFQKPYLIFIGWGKTYISGAKKSFFTDNDYLAALIIYGIIILSIFIFILLNFLLNILARWHRTNVIERTIFYIIIVSLLSSIASQGFFTFHWQLFILLMYRFYIASKRGEISEQKITTI